MGEIVDYKVVRSESLHWLEIRVKESMRDGWQPSGTLITYDNKDKGYYAQAMVQYKKDVPDYTLPLYEKRTCYDGCECNGK